MPVRRGGDIAEIYSALALVLGHEYFPFFIEASFCKQCQIFHLLHSLEQMTHGYTKCKKYRRKLPLKSEHT